jgi:hypothetical protein
VVCTFLALLELIRLRQLACLQPEPFAEIEISKAVAQPTLPVEEPPAPIAEAEVPQPIVAAESSKPAAEEATEEEESEDEDEDENEDEEDSDDDDDDDDDDDEEDEAEKK